MTGLVNYNFCGDSNSADPMPTSANSITTSTLIGGIYDHMNLSKDVNSSYSYVKPTEWDTNTLLNATFDGNLYGGTIGETVYGITQVKIKRREVGTFDWTTIKIIDITSIGDFSFTINDNLAKNDVEYEYAFVPIKNNIEGAYIKSTVLSHFTGIFICDATTIYKMYAGVKLGETDSTQQIGVFNPFGVKYPVIISNSLVNYQTGSFSGLVLPQNYEYGNVSLDRLVMTKERQLLVDFLSNNRGKILKTVNGDMWLCMIVGDVETTYSDGNMGAIPTVSMQWTEVGDKDSKSDMYNFGLIPSGD